MSIFEGFSLEKHRQTQKWDSHTHTHANKCGIFGYAPTCSAVFRYTSTRPSQNIARNVEMDSGWTWIWGKIGFTQICMLMNSKSQLNNNKKNERKWMNKQTTTTTKKNHWNKQSLQLMFDSIEKNVAFYFYKITKINTNILYEPAIHAEPMLPCYRLQTQFIIFLFIYTRDLWIW